MSQIDHLFIVGAGFSHYAGLPLTNHFTEELLNVGELKKGQSQRIVKFLRGFVYETFDHSRRAKARFWPQLEDLFTCIDLSANTGHYLGPKYSPKVLRTVRRALIVRTIRMLHQAYKKGKKEGGDDWKKLESFFASVPPDRCAFLSMNWDTVIEEGLERTQGISVFDYGCDAEHAEFKNSHIQPVSDFPDQPVQVLKPHGSINWLYCDACRQVFWFPAGGSTDQIAGHLFGASDEKIVAEFTREKYQPPKRRNPYNCLRCDSPALGTRFATFSYRKALEFPMHESSWRSAERLLREAKTWIFIGYSLPAADYEFKHLLKRVQLSRNRPELVLQSPA